MKTKYVSDSLKVPTSPSESQDYGIDLDGDPQMRPDNLLGSILSTLASQGVDVQAQIDTAIAEGRLVILHEVQADDFVTWPNAGWQVYLGNDTGGVAPAFDGTDTFTIDPAGPTDATLVGRIAGGQFTGGPSTVTIKIALVDGAPPLQLDLIGARVQADVAATSISNAKLGGAITQEDINTKVLPAVATMLNTSISNDPGCAMTPPMCGDSAQTLLDLFDHGISCTDSSVCPASASTCDTGTMKCTCGSASCEGQLDGDMVITVEELQSDELISSILAPDVDLLDQDGNYNPRSDGVKDSVSLGVGFTGVNATF